MPPGFDAVAVMLWARVRRLPMLAGVLTLLAVVLWLGRGHTIITPTVLGGGAAAMTWSTLVPLLWAAALCATYDGLGAQVEQRAIRRVGRLDVCLFCGADLAFAGVVTLATHQSAWVQVLAHSSALAGLATWTTARWTGSTGVLAATATVLITSSYSPYVAGAAVIRFLQPEGDPVFAAIAGVLLSGAAIVALVRRRRTPRDAAR